MAKMERALFITIRGLIAWAPSILWMVGIFTLSSRQSISVEGGYLLNFIIFKSLHVAEYAILTILFLFALKVNFPKKNIRALASYAVCGALLFALSDEYHQTFVPTRQGQVRDVLIDAIGIFSVYWVIALYENNSKFLTAYFRPRKSQ